MNKILLIEDEQDIRESLSDILELQKYKVYQAEDGNSGLINALNHYPDLIITDIMMPGFDGFQLVKHFKNINDLKEIPIIFLTAKAQPEDFRNGLKLGACDYITKPFKMKEVIDSVDKQFNRIRRIKNKQEKYFNLFFNNPFCGIFYYTNNNFFKINNRFSLLTGYSINELQKIKFKDIIAANANNIAKRINDCYTNVKNSDNFEALLLTKSKKTIEINIFLQNIEQNNSNAIIGIFSEKKLETNNNNKYNTNLNDLLNYFNNENNKEIAQKILNAKKIINFQKKSKENNIKKNLKLTQRELEVLQLICDGYSTPEIAKKLFISKRTVDNHRANMIRKTKTKNLAALVAFALKNKLVNL